MAIRYRPTITERSITKVTEPVTSSQEDQIRSYRRMARLRYEAQRLHVSRNGTRTLESQLNPEAELELSQRRRASLVPAETLYSINWSEPRHRAYQHYSETRILVTGGQQNLPLINQGSYTILRQEGMQLIHLGLVMIRVHALYRRNASVNALIVLRDTRWKDDISIISTMEVDLFGGTQLVYIAPNMLISVEDFFQHIELAIQTHGYEDWNMAESNLLITRGLIGRLTNTSHAGFRYNVQNIADYLASTGIHAIRIPQEVRTTTLLDGSISLSFQGYQSTRNPQPRRMSNFDIEEIKNEGEEEFAWVFISEYALPLFHEEYDFPDTNDRWDTLGEPSGKYNYYVNYAAPPIQPFIPPTRPSWGDEDEDDNEAVFPSIWEDTPWEEDPDFDPNELPTNIEDEEEDLSSYFLGLSNRETDCPINSPSSVLPEEDNKQQLPYWDDTDTDSEEYWQQVVEQVEQIEEQFYTTQTNSLPGRMNTLSVHENTSSTEEGEPNDWLPYINQSQDQESSQSEKEDTQATEEAAHVGVDSLVTKQLERLDYPILRSMMQQATTEKVLSSTSAISRYNPPQEPLMGQVNYPPAQDDTRIAPRSGVAFQLNFLINAGAIDSDFRGSLIKQNHLEISQNLQDLLKEQKKIQQAVLQLQKEILQQTPLTAKDIKELVLEVTKQPKLIEEKALALAEESKRQIKQIKEIMHEVKRQVNAGVNALVVLRDTRWRDDRSIIGTMEVDLFGAPPIQPFFPATKPSWGDEDEDEDKYTNNEAVFPSIWEDTPWEDDLYFEIEDLLEEPYPNEEEEEEREAYFLGLEDLENDYPTISPTSVLLGENQALPIHWDNSDDESNNYWQKQSNNGVLHKVSLKE
ncbi:hypothetical protein ZIOFF_061339 [Zingiber officinale]|uniref:Uncharacterized protein n=1 Tax=Zingiber officinale TaxID=94328 RepID=A0A8J5EYZ8_ZINOF|nr:hypothetical protein ZIOFF_061339 [Zingiber officinale]